MKLFLFIQFLLLGLLTEAAKTSTAKRTEFGAWKYINGAIDKLTQAEVRKEGKSIGKWRLSWLSADDLIKMPVMKLHSIPPSSWSGLSARQASKLTPVFVSRLTQDQAKMISPKSVKAMPEATRRAYLRMVRQPSLMHRLILLGVSGALAYALYRHTAVPITNK